MDKTEDIIGRRFNKLTVCEYIGVSKTRKYDRVFKCKCDCGNVIERGLSRLTSKTKSCGQCYVYGMIGKKFGRLLVISYEGKRGRASYFNCLCDCGNHKSIYGGTLTTGNNPSCGRCFKFDMIGKKYNKLTVLEFLYQNNEYSFFKCKCDCGNVIESCATRIKSGHTKSCGECNKLNMVGKIFGKLTVLGYAFQKNRRSHYNCRCECGKEVVVALTNLVQKNTVSCGCLVAKRESWLKDILMDLLGEKCMKIRPDWLKNPKTGYNLEIDIYFPESKIAVEYNGAQHYRPVNFTGHLTQKYMEDIFEKIKERDKLKAELIKKSGKVDKFIIFKYDDKLDKESVRDVLIEHNVPIGGVNG